MDPVSQKVTFAIPAYNCQEMITATVESIMNGNFYDGDEIIIVNDCSTDHTAEVLQQLAAHYSGIRIIHHLMNKGCSVAGRNTAIEQASNPLIFCLDNDNVLVPGSITPLKQLLMETNADIAAFQELHYFLYQEQPIPENVTHKWIYKEGVITFADALAGNYWPGIDGNYLFTRESWLKVGRCNEFVEFAIDSWAFGIKQLAKGLKMVTLPNRFYYHRYGHNSAFVKYSQGKNLSIAALEVMIPFLGVLEDADVEYIMSRKGRYQWFDQLAQRPLRVKNCPLGKTGERVKLKKIIKDISQKHKTPRPWYRRILNRLHLNKIRIQR